MACWLDAPCLFFVNDRGIPSTIYKEYRFQAIGSGAKIAEIAFVAISVAFANAKIAIPDLRLFSNVLFISASMALGCAPTSSRRL